MYLFNPDNDLALANFSANYTPPASALKIAEDLAVLPVWYAPNNSKIIAERTENEKFLSDLKELFAIESALISFADISHFSQEKIIPWGWNPALRKKLLEAGVSEDSLFSVQELKQLRIDSGRQNAIRILNELKAENSEFCGESHFFSTIDEVLKFLSSRNGDKVLKMPNSGSGKGLVWIFGEITDKQTDWCRRVIREQGGVVAEPVLKKVKDFAVEFEITNGRTEFIGYSLFRSAASGAYMGNFLMSDTDIEKILSKFVDVKLLQQLQKSLTKRLSQQFPAYSGNLGVDMMICQTEKGFQIQPCVEINLRMNMGLVAHIFYNRFVKNSSTGEFVVDYFKRQGDALIFQQKMQKDFPLVVENGKIKLGYLNLTPVAEQTQYVAWVIMEKPV